MTWQIKRLGEVATVIAGQSPAGTNYNRDGKGIPFYQGKKEFTEKYIASPTTWTTEITKEATSGDILMSVRAPVGPVNFSTQNICIGRGLAAIRPNRLIDKEYLFNFLVKHEGEIVGNTGAVFNSINKSQIENILLPLPPLPEQKRIVAVLDEAFDAIAKAEENAEKNLANTRELLENQLQSIFTQRKNGWMKKTLADLCEIKHGFAFKSEFFSRNGKHVLLTPGNFYESGGYRDRGEKQKYYSGEIPKGFILSKGDLLVAMTEQAAGLLGSPILIPESGKFLHNQRLGLVTKKQDVAWANEFFFHVFNTKPVRQAIHDSASGVKVRHTSPAKIGEVCVTFPASLTEQRAIVDKFTALAQETQRLVAIYQRKLADLKELKKSILQKAFSGELAGVKS